MLKHLQCFTRRPLAKTLGGPYQGYNINYYGNTYCKKCTLNIYEKRKFTDSKSSIKYGVIMINFNRGLRSLILIFVRVVGNGKREIIF